MNAGRRAHSLEYVVVGVDLRPDSGVGEITRNICSDVSETGLTNRIVSAGVIGVHVCIDDVLNWLIRKSANGGYNIIRHFGSSCSDDEYSRIANLNPNVGTRAGQQADV